MQRLIVIAFLLLITGPALAQDTVSLAWDLIPNEEKLGADGGYKIYQSKQSGVYSAPAATVPPGTNNVTLTDLPYGRLYWAVTAFAIDAESEYSNEVNKVIRPPAPRNLRETVLAAAVKPLKALVGLFASKKQLRIVENPS